MKIIISQQDKKLLITFQQNKFTDTFVVDKAEEFLVCVDRFIKKCKMKIESLKKADLRFENTGLLTERVIRAIILGLSFSQN